MRIRCARCKKLKPASQFYKVKSPSSAARHGHTSYCRPCNAENIKDWRRRTGGDGTRRIRQRLPDGTSIWIKVSRDEYEKILKRQRGVCRICRGVNSSGRSLSVDHCHKTKRIRGILCSNCNTAIGMFRDDPKILLRAVEYLKTA